MYGVGWFPTAVRIRLSQPPAGLGLGLSLATSWGWVVPRSAQLRLAACKLGDSYSGISVVLAILLLPILTKVWLNCIFFTTWIVSDFPQEVPNFFLLFEILILYDKNLLNGKSLFPFHRIRLNVSWIYLNTFHYSWPELIGATGSHILQFLLFYTKSAETSPHH